MKRIVFILILSSLSFAGLAQIGVGTDSPNDRAILHLEAVDKGFLMPRLNTGQTDAMTLSPVPPAGMMVYNSDSNEVYVFNGAVWESVTPFKKQHAQGAGNKGRIQANGHALNVKSVNATTVNATTVNGFGTVPVGGIIMWRGTTPPAGWALCNGGNGTPDLRNKFIVSTGSTYSLNQQGGANTVTLLTTHLPSHQHSGTTNNDGAHQHRGNTGGWADNDDDDHKHHYIRQESHNPADGHHHGRQTVYQYGSEHQHNFTSNNCIGCNSTAIENRPEYYALAFIMRIQ